MAERKKKVPFGYFFQFYVLLKRTAGLLIVCECKLDIVLRGRRTKGLRCRPFVNTRNQRKGPLDTSQSAVHHVRKNKAFVHRYNLCKLYVFIIANRRVQG